MRIDGPYEVRNPSLREAFALNLKWKVKVLTGASFKGRALATPQEDPSQYIHRRAKESG